MLLCPQCGSPSRCKYTVPLDDGSTRRRRRCTHCEFRFSTLEQVHNFIPQDRDEQGKFTFKGAEVPKGYFALVPDCNRCENYWAGKCELGHPDPATCGAYVSAKKAAATEVQ